MRCRGADGPGRGRRLGCPRRPQAVPSAGSWGRAIEVTGLGALNKGASGDVVVGVNSVSCGAAGNCARNCAAGGGYTDRRGHGQGFVAAERHGRWVKAIEVPGLGALNKGGDAYVGSVSCASAGNCAAGGLYTGRHRGQQGFVAVEKNGVWRRAIEVPGLGALNKGGSADVFSVSCASAGSCAAVGDYTDGGSSGQGFVAVERHGRWGTAMNVPGLRALNQGGDAGVSSVSAHGRAAAPPAGPTPIATSTSRGSS